MSETTTTTTQPENADPTTEGGNAAETTTTTQPDDENPPTAGDDGPDVFPRTYVEKLRRENASYRDRARISDARLHTELVRATGKLADPTDLPFNIDHLEDGDALSAAIDELLARKPHLASRRVAGGDIGQGASSAATPVDLAAMLRARA